MKGVDEGGREQEIRERMHIPDGFLGPKTCLACFAAVAPFWGLAWRGLRRRMEMSFEVPYVALASAFVFVLMMFNVPIPGGTSGHAVGTAIVAIALGVGPAILAVTFALAVQALLFQDGGITAFGANVLTMAVVQALVAAGVWKVLGPRTPTQATSRRVLVAGFAAGYLAALASATTTGATLGVQPLLERGTDGLPRYFPLGLQVTLPAMLLSHLLVGILEGAVSGLAVSYLAKRPQFLGNGSTLYGMNPANEEKAARQKPDFLRRRAFWMSAAAIIVAVPLGIWLPAAVRAAEPWGEWTPAETAQVAGLQEVPSGMARLADFWRAPVPDYAFGEEAGPAGESIQYVGSALLGVLALTFLFSGISLWQRRQVRRAE